MSVASRGKSFDEIGPNRAGAPSEFVETAGIVSVMVYIEIYCSVFANLGLTSVAGIERSKVIKPIPT